MHNNHHQFAYAHSIEFARVIPPIHIYAYTHRDIQATLSALPLKYICSTRGAHTFSIHIEQIALADIAPHRIVDVVVVVVWHTTIANPFAMIKISSCKYPHEQFECTETTQAPSPRCSQPPQPLDKQKR